MKVLIISDTHGKNDFPNLIKEVKPDFTIHAGDVIDFHDHTTWDMWDDLKKSGIIDKLIWGNHEVTVDMEKKGIPFSKFTNEMTKYYEVFELNKKKFFLFHAFHKDERCEEYGEQDLDFLKWRDDKIKEIKPDYVITGHTHIAGVYEKNGVVFINPGSLNFPRFPQEHPSYIIGTDNDDGNFDWNVKFIK